MPDSGQSVESWVVCQNEWDHCCADRGEKKYSSFQDLQNQTQVKETLGRSGVPCIDYLGNEFEQVVFSYPWLDDIGIWREYTNIVTFNQISSGTSHAWVEQYQSREGKWMGICSIGIDGSVWG
jgi:hypothetical protein